MAGRKPPWVRDSADTNLASVITRASETYGVSENFLRTVLVLESGDKERPNHPPNPKARNGQSVGIAQFQPDAAREVGLIINHRRDDRLDPEKSIMGLAEYAKNNQSLFRRTLGRDAEDYQLYMMHQEGPGGALALFKNPDRKAVDVLSRFHGQSGAIDVIRKNGGDPSMTAGEFVEVWKKNYEKTAHAFDGPQKHGQWYSSGKPPEKTERDAQSPPERSENTNSDAVARNYFGVSTLGQEFFDAGHHTPDREAAIARHEAEQSAAEDRNKSPVNHSFTAAAEPARYAEPGFANKSSPLPAHEQDKPPEPSGAPTTEGQPEPRHGFHRGPDMPFWNG